MGTAIVWCSTWCEACYAPVSYRDGTTAGDIRRALGAEHVKTRDRVLGDTEPLNGDALWVEYQEMPTRDGFRESIRGYNRTLA